MIIILIIKVVPAKQKQKKLIIKVQLWKTNEEKEKVKKEENKIK